MSEYNERIINHMRITVTSRKTGNVTTVLETKEGEDDHKTGPVVAGIPLTECVDNSLDSFTFTSMGLDTKEPFRRYDIVNLTITDDKVSKYEMLVQHDHVETLSRQFQTYKHTVTAIELTKILEKTKIFNLNLTNPHDTLLDQLKKAIVNAELIVGFVTDTLSYKRKCRFSVSPELTALLEGVPGEDFYNGNTDLRAVLDNILSVVNARVEVMHIELDENTHDIENIVLGYRSLTNVQNIVPNWTQDGHGEIVGEELESDAQDYAGKIVARGYNTVMREPITFTDVFKTDEAKLSDENAMIFLPFPIGEQGFESFKVPVLCLVNYKPIGAQASSADHFYIDVDIASAFCNDQDYALLDTYGQNTHLPFQIGATSFGANKTISKFAFNWSSLNLILEKKSYELSDEYIKQELKKYGKNIVSASLSNASPDFKKVWFTATYYPRADTVTEITKPGMYNKDDLLLGIMDGQSEKTLDLARQGRRLDSLIRRTGNGECYIDVRAKRFSSLLPRMAKIDLPVDKTGYKDIGYVVYKRECAIYDTFVKCRYYLSKDFNIIQQNAGVNREKHLYDIPLESEDAPIVFKQYMVFSTKRDSFDVSPHSAYKLEFMGSALRTFFGENTGKINYLLFRSFNGKEQFPRDTEIEISDDTMETPYTEQHVFVRPCLTYGQSKTMNFVAYPLDNYSTDYSRNGFVFSIWGDKGEMITYNRYVSKRSATAGEFDSIRLSYAFNYTPIKNRYNYGYKDFDEALASIEDFPVAKENLFDKASKYDIEITYNKDRTQRPVFYGSIECVPSESDYGKIIIGSAFCRDNNLVKDNGSGLTGLKLVISRTKTIDVSAEYFPSGYEEETHSVSDIFKLETPSFAAITAGMYGLIRKNTAVASDDTVKSWAIINEKREIYLAYNGALANIYAQIFDFPQ